MAAHLAVARIDEILLWALQTLAAKSDPLGSVDDFVANSHPLPVHLRKRLLETLGLSGIAHAVAALRAGADTTGVTRALRQLSGVDGVVAVLAELVAEAGYRRVRSTVHALEAIMSTADAGIAGPVFTFLTDDDTAMARMAAAVDVVEAAGMAVDPGDDPKAHLRRASYWRRYGSGPVRGVHRDCGTDIVRGSLRLWRQAEVRRVKP
jgi:hypothetical protein